MFYAFYLIRMIPGEWYGSAFGKEVLLSLFILKEGNQGFFANKRKLIMNGEGFGCDMDISTISGGSM